jgi:dUTP pyrophosphatase
MPEPSTKAPVEETVQTEKTEEIEKISSMSLLTDLAGILENRPLDQSEIIDLMKHSFRLEQALEVSSQAQVGLLRDMRAVTEQQELIQKQIAPPEPTPDPTIRWTGTSWSWAPEKGTPGSAAWDLTFPNDEGDGGNGVEDRIEWVRGRTRRDPNAVTLTPGDKVIIDTGLNMAIPEGYVGIISSRSGVGIIKGLCVAQGVGVIDSDYRGRIKVAIVNNSTSPQVIKSGERFAQLTILPICRFQAEEVKSLDDTERGKGGFGSTGTEARETPRATPVRGNTEG